MLEMLEQLGIKIPGITSRNDTSRIDHGVGYVHERTVEFGDTIVTVHNIGSMMMFDGNRNHLPGLVGCAIVALSLVLFFSSKVFGTLLLLGGVALVIWNFRRPVHVFLSIGTGDGRFTNIVSKNKKFLQEIRAFLRTKLDSNNAAMQATINIGKATLETSGGPVVMNNDGVVVGAFGSVAAGQGGR